MNWNKHYDLEGKHAMFSPSRVSWINYSDEKAFEFYQNMLATEKGTEDHAFAALCIKRRQKLQKSELSSYVNDAIGFKMDPEVTLYYSENFFGTTDAINYSEKNKFLRIHDLKTGAGPTHIEQLEIYAALFCLEYEIRPEDISIELRIYQRGEIFQEEPLVETIRNIMERIVTIDKQIDIWKAGGLLAR